MKPRFDLAQFLVGHSQNSRRMHRRKNVCGKWSRYEFAAVVG